MDPRLKELAKQYKATPIPKQLDEIVEKSIQYKRRKHVPKWLLGVAAAIVVFTISINVSPTMARTLVAVPIIGNVVEVLTFTQYHVQKGQSSATIDIPKIQGDSEDITALNEQYIAEGKQLYEQFLEGMESLEQFEDGGHLAINSGYIVATNTEQLLSVGRYVEEIVGSSSTTMKYDTIDKRKEIVITLPSLFKDDVYIATISTYLEGQMRNEMIATNQEKMYWVREAGLEEDELIEPFQTIQAEQNFYITEKGKLVIVFDKYEVAPGYMGVVEFEIPTALIQSSLVSNEYIR